jgi:hypothetical protein
LIQNERESESSIQKIDPGDSIVAYRRHDADFFNTISHLRPSRRTAADSGSAFNSGRTGQSDQHTTARLPLPPLGSLGPIGRGGRSGRPGVPGVRVCQRPAVGGRYSRQHRDALNAFIAATSQAQAEAEKVARHAESTCSLRRNDHGIPSSRSLLKCELSWYCNDGCGTRPNALSAADAPTAGVQF